MQNDDSDYFISTTKLSEIDSICVGSGRFLRGVLVPALVGAGLKPAIFQTRGRTFLDYCRNNCTDNGPLSFEVDTVDYDGNVKTDAVKCYAVGTLGCEEGKRALMKLLDQMQTIRIIGVGVTEAGLASSSSKALWDLTDILRKCYFLTSTSQLTCSNPHGRICVLNTDNVAGNGRTIRSHMLDIVTQQELSTGDSTESLLWQWLQPGGGVTFHDSMVDRITSQRSKSGGMVPRCEPVPAKAIVIEDLGCDLPPALRQHHIHTQFGLVVRNHAKQLDSDIALKLRVANGTHTAAAHAMSLSSILFTNVLSDSNNSQALLIMKYLDHFFQSQILPAAQPLYGNDETLAVYKDWRKRLCHPHFGLSTFFITQNGAAKVGIRISPTVRDLIADHKNICTSTAFAIAATLRFLTPCTSTSVNPPSNEIYTGWLDGSTRSDISTVLTDSDSSETVTYADKLRYNLSQGWYEFRCNCSIQLGHKIDVFNLPDILSSFKRPLQPKAYNRIVSAFLCSSHGGNLKDVMHDHPNDFRCLVFAVSTLYARMVAGDAAMLLLREMAHNEGPYREHGFDTPCSALVDGPSLEGHIDIGLLHYRPSPIPTESCLMSLEAGNDFESIASVVLSEVSSAEAIDLHTHLLPPSHGALCLWGIDELLTYHYLVSEYFMTSPPSVSPSDFFALSKQEQANKIWKALFIDRSPISEACRGVITTLQALGLGNEIRARDLEAIRGFYRTFRDQGEAGAQKFSDLVYKLAGVRYAIMTNIPFDVNEASHWRPAKKEYSNNYRSALRVDPLLAGDRNTIELSLKASGYDLTIEGARKYLRDWCDTIQPEYMMASTPHNFVFSPTRVKKTGVNEDATNTPFAFVDIASIGDNAECDAQDDDTPSIIDENSDFVTQVLMKICEERDLPLALKVGAHRGVNPSLKQAGDGIVAFADAAVLARLCSRFPKVRFLATFLSRNNQHEACVLASKFSNLHIYGCWWYCNNPSIIQEITTMRIEMLGTAFTAQHSDARVLDQLVYKWSHSRVVIANVLQKEYFKLFKSGWVPTRCEVRRDVKRLFGGSYEEFMQKSFVQKTDE